MKKIKIFNEEIILNKTIYIMLDITSKSLKQVEGSYTSALTVSEMEAAIKEQYPNIMTTQTHYLNSHYMEKGYDIFIISEGQKICVSDMLGNGDYSFGKEIRPAQNWEKMLYAGCFNIKLPF